MRKLRPLLLPTLLALAACGGDAPVATSALPKDLATFTVRRRWRPVRAGLGRRGRGGASADLAAQTAGRVSAVAVDVNDRVARRRGAAAPHRGGTGRRAPTPRAPSCAPRRRPQPRPSRTTGALPRWPTAQYVSKAQIDQARAARDSAVAARDAAARACWRRPAQQSQYTVVRAPFDGIVARARRRARRDRRPGPAAAGGVRAGRAAHRSGQCRRPDAEAIREAMRARRCCWAMAAGRAGGRDRVPGGRSGQPQRQRARWTCPCSRRRRRRAPPPRWCSPPPRTATSARRARCAHSRRQHRPARRTVAACTCCRTAACCCASCGWARAAAMRWR